ncbi:MAG: efflux transporter outer membrane subunit [Bryobacterales bacterium]|nr:efflux transporter outer membrane subunit [Bryobacterales bacterium]
MGSLPRSALKPRRQAHLNQNVPAAEAQYRRPRSYPHARLPFPPPTSPSSPVPIPSPPSIPFSPGLRSLLYPSAISYQADVGAASAAPSPPIAPPLRPPRATRKRPLYQSDLAAGYFQYRGALAVRRLLTDTVQSYEQYLQLTRDRYASGVASMGDVAQARTQLETTRAALTDLGVQIAQLRHAIAVLAGKVPAGFSIPLHPLPANPPEIPVALPSALLERRPDIAAIERQVAAANEQIGIAQAALYPTISLSAGAGSESATFLKILTASSYFWSAGGELAQTLFDRGRRRAQISLTRAAYDAIASNYRQTVLTAFQQVEDELAALRILEEEAAVQERAVAASQQSLQISTAQYQGGVQSYLQVITSQTFALQNQVSAADIQTRRMVASVLLIQALGGGWDISQLPVT